MAKKTNYVQYEIVKLEKYLKQLEAYLDDNPPHKMVDRVEWIPSTRAGGSPTIKVIASKEAQLKTFNDILQKLPSMYLSLNELRRVVNDEGEETKVRAGADLPGFMKNARFAKDDEVDTKANHEFHEEQFDDDDTKETELPITETEEETPSQELQRKIVRALPVPKQNEEYKEEDFEWSEEDDE